LIRFLTAIFILLFVLVSCNKARKCECVDGSLSAAQSGMDTAVFYINGNKKDSKKACANLADSTETCTLKDK
jgi:hypothetical protein